MVIKKHLRGLELRVGDTIEIWWGTDTITNLKPYTGNLKHLYPTGAQIADFARNKIGMTINNSEFYILTARRGE